MSQAGSYVLGTFSTTKDAEIKRLQAQADLFWEKELRCYRLYGLADGMAVVECGSGPGYVLDKILAAFPGCACTGVEIDQEFVEVHRQRLAAQGMNRCTVVQNSILSTGLPDSSFDFAITRLVLEHLPNPLDAVREVWRILKPGGKAVFIDNDFEFHLTTYPEIPPLKMLYDAYCRSMSAAGGNPKIGRQLPTILREAGFEHIDLEILSAHSETAGDRAFLKSEGVGISTQLVKDGYLNSAMLDAIATGWHDMLEKENHVFFRQVFCAVGQKSLTGKAALKESSAAASRSDAQAKEKDASRHPSAGGQNSLEDLIVQQVAASLQTAAEALRKDVPLTDIGFDSLAAVELKSRIKTELGVDLPIADFFMGQTLDGIIRQVQGIVHDKPQESSPGSGPTRKDAPGSGSGWDEGVL